MSRGPPEAPFAHVEAVLVVPPFSATFQANLACHLLQACARLEGFNVAVIYGNLIFASMIGHRAYATLVRERLRLEHIFADQAFGTCGGAGANEGFKNKPALIEGSRAADAWLDRMVAIIGSIGPKVVGSTCSFEQITASVALLNRCKEAFPEIVTVIGGANCEGEMAEGIVSFGSKIDHVASGECERAFPLFLKNVLRDGVVPDRIIKGQSCRDLDLLPLPDYREYFAQYSFYLPDQAFSNNEPAVPYESSRGCWWGEKHHCTFCGLNGSNMAFRQKSADRAFDELTHLAKTYPVRRINAVDNIMPHRYFSTLLPRLAAALPDDLTVFYEQKSNISLAKAMALKDARITVIQPGIEALNSHLLECIDKGVKAYQNVALLRYARSLDIDVTWNLLAGFPGDRPEDYEQTTALIDYIAHLQPPDGPDLLRIDRFSPYYDNPEKYGIRNLRPKSIYYEIFPQHSDFKKLAYYFDGDYESGAFECRDILNDIETKLETWRQRWQFRAKPILAIAHLFGEQFALIDSRGPGDPEALLIDRAKAMVALCGDRGEPDDIAWALEHRLLFELDNRLVPLATAAPSLLMEFEQLATARFAA